MALEKTRAMLRRPSAVPCHGPSSAAGEEAQGAFLLEVEGPARGGRDPAEAPAEVGHGRPDLRFGQYTEAEG
jgi:hypothetical protein